MSRFKKLFNPCTRHLLNSFYLSRFKKEIEILICFFGICECVFRTSFLLTLDIYNAYFRGRHIIKYKENICKRWPMPYSLRKKLLHLLRLRVLNQVLLDLHCWWSENLCSQHLLQVGVLVTYWDPCKRVVFIYWRI